MTWGEQTDVPESADWYNSSYIIASGLQRAADPHRMRTFTEVRYKGTKTVAITPDYAEIAKLCDLWLAPKQGTDAAMALAMGHVMLRESTSISRASISPTMCAAIPTCRCW